MKRTYIDIIGKIHEYNYDTDNMTTKPKCNKCHKRMNHIFGINLGKYKKLGFVCFKCNKVYIKNSFSVFLCKIIIKLNNRIKG